LTMPEESGNNTAGKEVLKFKHELFERTFLPYLNSAYNLARWLTRNEDDAEDVVQDALLRAFESFATFIPGRDARAWLLAIVRNCCRTWLRRNRPHELTVPLDDASPALASAWPGPDAAMIAKAGSQLIHDTLKQLPIEYREILILRELEELSYKEIAQIAGIPVGTVMSRLSRARKELYGRLSRTTEGTVL
jgi:RNA polymerase sigma factor (sigma-70 family)